MVGLIDSIPTCKDLITTMVKDAEDILNSTHRMIQPVPARL